LLCWCAFLPLVIPALPVAAAPDQRCFAETGQCIAGRFLAYWDANGGLGRNGYPLTPERREVLEDGKEYTVQYFERVRMEYHPENAAPYDVLLGQFGRLVYRESFSYSIDRLALLQPTTPKPGWTYFPETGHNVSPSFYAYWQANGGLAQLGYPLAEAVTYGGGDGPTRSEQYFERGRLEEHPENAGTPYAILLGQFGRTVLGWRDTPLAPPFAARYNGDPTRRARVGTPNPGSDTAKREVLPFEHGLTLASPATTPTPGYRGVDMLCGTPDAGMVTLNARTGWFGLSVIVHSNDELPGGGPGPRTGTYEPGGAVGVLWNNGVFHECLGYATAPAPIAQTIITQSFSRGVLIALPERGEIYALYLRVGEPSMNGGFFRRYPLR